MKKQEKVFEYLLKKRIKELELINQSHKDLNGRLITQLKEHNNNKTIEIVVMGGMVTDVNNLPNNYVYKIKDLDKEEERIRQHNKKEGERITKL
jgi:hypothetical protein